MRGRKNLQLSIRHDGIGFDPEALDASVDSDWYASRNAHIADATLSISHGIRMKMVVPIRGATRENSTHSARR